MPGDSAIERAFYFLACGVAGLLLPLQQAVFGVLIIGFLIFEPHGLAAIWARVRRTFHLWPFRP